MNARQQSGFLEDLIMTNSRSSAARSEHDRLQISCYKAGTGLSDELIIPAKKDSQSSAARTIDHFYLK